MKKIMLVLMVLVLANCVVIDDGEDDAFVCRQISKSENGYLVIFKDNPEGSSHSYIQFFTEIKPTVEIGDTLKAW